MLPLAASSLPPSHAALAEAITSGFAKYGLTAREIRAEGGTFPQVASLRVDLTGARAHRGLRPAEPGAAGAERIEVERVEVVATPLYFEATPLQLDLHAQGTVLALAHGADSEPMLVLVRAAQGAVTVEARLADLEALAQSLVASAAAKQGVEIKSTHLKFTSRGPRALAFEAEVAAKMFIMTAKVAVAGTLELDDQLNARLSGLACRGEGMIASAANALLKPRFAEIEHRTFPLLALTLGEVKLRDVRLDAGEALRVHAEFGA